jgi:hypothetical protein
VEERLEEQCRGWDSNPHVPEGTADFKSACLDQLGYPGDAW